MVTSADIIFLEIQTLWSSGISSEMRRSIFIFAKVKTVSGGRDSPCKSQWQPQTGTFENVGKKKMEEDIVLANIY